MEGFGVVEPVEEALEAYYVALDACAVGVVEVEFAPPDVGVAQFGRSGMKHAHLIDK